MHRLLEIASGSGYTKFASYSNEDLQKALELERQQMQAAGATALKNVKFNTIFNGINSALRSVESTGDPDHILMAHDFRERAAQGAEKLKDILAKGTKDQIAGFDNAVIRRTGVDVRDALKLPLHSPTLFEEDAHGLNKLKYMADAIANGSMGAKSLTNAAQIGAVALPALLGGLGGGLSSDGTLLGGALRGAATGAGGLGGYAAGKALADTDWAKNLGKEHENLRLLMPFVTAGGGALLSNWLAGKFTKKKKNDEEEKSASAMTKLAFAYRTQAVQPGYEAPVVRDVILRSLA